MSYDLILKSVLTALCAGFFIGLERQFHFKAAGIRTHSLVAVGASVFVLMSHQIQTPDSNMDPSRILGQVVVGVGFLGAGVIMKQGATILGLNSAATIWCSAAMGSMAGMGWYIEAIVLSFLIVIINFFGRKIENLKVFRN